MEMELIGAIKVKDGLFLGDEFAAQDLEFVVANKVTHIINTAARQVPNHWEPIGVKYVSLYWLDHDTQVLWDNRDDLFAQIYEFIEAALKLGESVLVHSVRGQCRCVCALAAYMMKKFRWALFKTLEFLNSRRPDIDIRPGFLQQLAALENRFARSSPGVISNSWNEVSDDPNTSNEELVLRNTFLNSQAGEIADYHNTSEHTRDKSFKITWLDNNTGDPEKLTSSPHPSSLNPVESGFAIIRSCIKGASQQELKVPIQSFKKPRYRSEGVFNQRMLNYKKIDSESTIDATTDDLIKLADSVHQNMMRKSRQPEVDENRAFRVNSLNKRDISPNKKETKVRGNSVNSKDKKLKQKITLPPTNINIKTFGLNIKPLEKNPLAPVKPEKLADPKRTPVNKKRPATAPHRRPQSPASLEAPKSSDSKNRVFSANKSNSYNVVPRRARFAWKG